MQIMNLCQQSMPPGEDLRIKSIHLKIGKLTAIVPQSMRMCMEVVTKDTPAEGVELVFTEVPLVVECSECGEETQIEEPPFKCGKCENDKVDIVSGREMIVESIEVEEEKKE